MGASGPGYASDGTTLVEVVDAYEADGFTGQFVPADDGCLRCISCRQTFDAGSVEVAGLRRTEGASDPADMAAVVALVCPLCAVRGTATLHYGPGAGVEEAESLKALDRAGGGNNDAPPEGDSDCAEVDVRD